MRALVDQYDDRLLIGEIYLPVNELVRYYGTELSGVHLPFNFQLIVLPWDAPKIYDAINEYEASVPEGAWPNWVLGNHDKPRIASRAGRAQARVAAMLLLTLRGTPTLYYGDELGMTDVAIPADKVQDPPEKNVPGRGLGRDPERTPMQWNSDENSGFSKAEPWLPVASDFPEYNVEQEKRDPGSFLSLYRQLLDLRREQTAFSVGRFTPVYGDSKIIAYGRDYEEDSFLVILNLSHDVTDFHHPHSAEGTVILDTSGARRGVDFNGSVTLAADEGLIVKMNG